MLGHPIKDLYLQKERGNSKIKYTITFFGVCYTRGMHITVQVVSKATGNLLEEIISFAQCERAGNPGQNADNPEVFKQMLTRPLLPGITQNNTKMAQGIEC
jgi:hypothetical protein